jgi:vacuolar-type H+-ATPase subunit I/STV1
MFSPDRNRLPPTAELSCPELRQALSNRASELQQFIPFQASVQPHVEHLNKEVQALKAQATQHEKKIEEMEKALETPQPVDTQTTDEEREAKIAQIRELEEQYEKLLAEKAKYLELGEQVAAF